MDHLELHHVARQSMNAKQIDMAFNIRAFFFNEARGSKDDRCWPELRSIIHGLVRDKRTCIFERNTFFDPFVHDCLQDILTFLRTYNSDMNLLKAFNYYVISTDVYIHNEGQTWEAYEKSQNKLNPAKFNKTDDVIRVCNFLQNKLNKVRSEKDYKRIYETYVHENNDKLRKLSNDFVETARGQDVVKVGFVLTHTADIKKYQMNQIYYTQLQDTDGTKKDVFFSYGFYYDENEASVERDPDFQLINFNKRLTQVVQSTGDEYMTTFWEIGRVFNGTMYPIYLDSNISIPFLEHMQRDSLYRPDYNARGALRIQKNERNYLLDIGGSITQNTPVTVPSTVDLAPVVGDPSSCDRLLNYSTTLRPDIVRAKYDLGMARFEKNQTIGSEERVPYAANSHQLTIDQMNTFKDKFWNPIELRPSFLLSKMDDRHRQNQHKLQPRRYSSSVGEGLEPHNHRFSSNGSEPVQGRRSAP